MISNVKSYRHSLIEVLIPVCLAIAAGVFLTCISSNGQIGFVSGIVFILVGLYPFARAWVRRDFDAFEIINIFVLYMILGIGIRGLVGIKYGTYFFFYDPNSEHFDILRLKVFSYSTIALLSLYLGYYSRLGNRWLSVLPGLNFDWQKTKVVICLVIYFLIGGVALIWYTIKFGNWEGIYSFGEAPAKIQGQVMYGGRAHVTSFFQFFWVVFYASCIYMFSKKRTIWTNIAFLSCLLYICIFFIHFGGKTVILTMIIVYIVSRHYLKRMISAKMFAVLIIAIFILSPFLWHVRGYGIYHWGILKHTYISALSNPMEFLHPFLRRSYGFDSFALFVEAIDSGKGLELGATITHLFCFFIPRVWWPEKPLAFPVTFLPKYANMDSYACMAPTLPGELYVNFHMIGVVLGFLLLGILMKLCYQCLIKRNHNNSSLLIYMPVLLLTPVLFEGGINKIPDFLITLFPVIIFLWFVKSKG